MRLLCVYFFPLRTAFELKSSHRRCAYAIPISDKKQHAIVFLYSCTSFVFFSFSFPHPSTNPDISIACTCATSVKALLGLDDGGKRARRKQLRHVFRKSSSSIHIEFSRIAYEKIRRGTMCHGLFADTELIARRASGRGSRHKRRGTALSFGLMRRNVDKRDEKRERTSGSVKRLQQRRK